MSGIQVYGKKSTLQAAENNAVAKWAIFEGKNPRFKYDADDDMDVSLTFLEKILTLLESSMTIAKYDLRFYEELKEGQKINNETKYNTSFTFRLTEGEDGYHQRRFDYTYHKELQDRITQLEAEQEDDEPINIGKVVQGFIDDPAKLYPIINTINAVRSWFTGGPLPAAVAMDGVGQVNRMGTRPTQDNATAAGNGPAQRLAAALDRLEKKDNKLVDHMEALADIAENDPMTWEFMISSLDKRKKK